ncbi:hypothetical protein GCM10017557_75550 [Streptomyces aurantiacus]|uniref:Uncharacterized protein n=1 Tax=Streptomyces aurantiacus TaxID=47760 RepID=A0A7G1PFZ2_9ACTN|nr:hypothetical protein GCM10017557_75550 [Streptomyces aurantiacus]
MGRAVEEVTDGQRVVHDSTSGSVVPSYLAGLLPYPPRTVDVLPIDALEEYCPPHLINILPIQASGVESRGG